MADIVAIPVGVGPPVALSFQYQSPSANLLTVSAVTLMALNTSVAGAVAKTWNALLVPDIGQAVVLSNLGRIVYPFNVGGGDVDSKGLWKLDVLLTLPGGTWPGDPLLTPVFRAVDQWGRP